MSQMCCLNQYARIILASGALIACQVFSTQGAELKDEASWYISPGVGVIDFEGDEEVNDGSLFSIHLGYVNSKWWSYEGSVYLAPDLTERFVGVAYTGRVSRADSDKAGFGSTYATGASLEAMFHFLHWEGWRNVDPYLAAGVGFVWYGEEINDHQFDPVYRIGAGIMYHLGDNWALRADWRSLVSGNDGQANTIMDVGLIWEFGPGTK